MYIFSSFSILSLITIRNKTDNHMFNVFNIFCTDFPHKTSWCKKLPLSSNGVTGFSAGDGGLT